MVCGSSRGHRNISVWVPASGETIIANGQELLTDAPGKKGRGTRMAIPPIPPHAENYPVIGITAYTEPVMIYQFQPHAHLRGKDFLHGCIYPDGREETVLRVPKYYFNWQLAYELDTPLKLPAGSKLVVTAHLRSTIRWRTRTTLGQKRKCTFAKRTNAGRNVHPVYPVHHRRPRSDQDGENRGGGTTRAECPGDRRGRRLPGARSLRNVGADRAHPTVSKIQATSSVALRNSRRRTVGQPAVSTARRRRLQSVEPQRAESGG